MDNLLYRLNARFVKRDVIGHVPEGERTNFHYVGEIEGPELSGSLRGIDYALTIDGVVHVHIHEVLTTADGDLISLERVGVSVPVDDPDAVLLQGEGHARTASARLAWLNDTPLKWEARFDRNSVHFSAWVARA